MRENEEYPRLVLLKVLGELRGGLDSVAEGMESFPFTPEELDESRALVEKARQALGELQWALSEGGDASVPVERLLLQATRDVIAAESYMIAAAMAFEWAPEDLTCQACGEPLVSSQERWERICSECKAEQKEAAQ